MSDAKRFGEIVNIASAVRPRPTEERDLERSLFGTEWTDEQWAEHDRAVAEREAEQRRTEAARDHANRCRSFRTAGFPQRALDAAIAADESAPAIAKIRAWSETSDNVLVLSGAPGCGKTVAAAWWAWRRQHAPTFIRASTFAAGSRYDQTQREIWSSATALVLDDLGAEYLDAKGSFLVDLDELIDTYYGNRKPLVITTNCTAVDFKARYGERIADRIRECGSWISIASASMRRKAAP